MSMSEYDQWLEGYRKHIEEWKEYTKKMEHDFVGGFCNKCYASKPDIDSGFESRFCRGTPVLDTKYTPQPVKTEPFFEPKQVHPANCTCTMLTLMQKGCACGGK